MAHEHAEDDDRKSMVMMMMDDDDDDNGDDFDAVGHLNARRKNERKDCL